MPQKRSGLPAAIIHHALISVCLLFLIHAISLTLGYGREVFKLFPKELCTFSLPRMFDI